MSDILRYELKKVFKCKPIYFSIIIITILTLLTNMFIAMNAKDLSRYGMTINTVWIFSTVMLFTVFLAISSYILGIEYKFDTLKIVKTKVVTARKVFTAKILVLLIYTIILTSEVFLISMITGMFYPVDDVKVLINQSIIGKNQVGYVLAKIYILQCIGNISIAAFSMMIVSFIRKVELSIIITIVVMLFFYIISIVVHNNIITYVLPFNDFDSVSIVTNKNLNIGVVMLQRAVYSFIIFFITYIKYNKISLD